jgi:NitT/TauT family transport system permease protein
MASKSAGVVTALAPAIAGGVALAVHRLVPNTHEEPLNWLAALPAWKHPYPVLLYTVVVVSLLAAMLHLAGRGRATTRHVSPLIAGATALLLVWEVVTVKMGWLQQAFFPGPDVVFAALVEDREVLADSAWNSLQLLAAGYFTGVLSGVTCGVLIGWFPSFRYWAMPGIKFVGPIPATALIPVAFALWRTPFPGGVFLIAFAVWFPVTILTSSGIANVRLSYLDVARTLGAGRAYLIFRVAIPAAMPHIFVGLFMGLGASFLSLAVAETVGVQSGIGWYINLQRGNMDYAKFYATLLICAAFFSTIMTLLFKVRDYVLSWQKGVLKW